MKPGAGGGGLSASLEAGQQGRGAAEERRVHDFEVRSVELQQSGVPLDVAHKGGDKEPAGVPELDDGVVAAGDLHKGGGMGAFASVCWPGKHLKAPA